jgi:dynein heavy chain
MIHVHIQQIRALYFGFRYQDTSTVIPMVFLLSTGSDPCEAFHCFANEMGKVDKLWCISLGQGQGPVAEKMISLGAVKGDWLFLQVCTVKLRIMEPLFKGWLILFEKLLTHTHTDYIIHE